MSTAIKCPICGVLSEIAPAYWFNGRYYADPKEEYEADGFAFVHGRTACEYDEDEEKICCPLDTGVDPSIEDYPVGMIFDTEDEAVAAWSAKAERYFGAFNYNDYKNHRERRSYINGKR